MPLRRGLRTPLALAAVLLVQLALGQPTFTIGLDQSATGVVAMDATTHVYLLDVPAGSAGFTIEVRGEDRDADLAVYYGDEELFSDISAEPNPTYAVASPRSGRYRIEVLNLLWQELPYTIRVRSGAVDVPRPTPPVAIPGSGATDAGFIELGGTRTGVVPASEIYREYALQVPAGTRGFTVRLTAGGADADMAVYFGSEELYDDISLDPDPEFAVANPRAGTYRIVVKNLLADDLAYVLSVTVDGAAPARPGGGAAVLELGSGVVASGGSIVVRFAGAPGNVRDWIGLYARGATDRQFVSWQYLEGAASGERTFVAPDDVGTYEFRMFENDGYDRLAVSLPFDVGSGAAPGPRPGAAPDPTGPSVPLTCLANARSGELADLAEGARATVTCPANCSAGVAVWGTDVYTDDSNVCAAAAHAGVIDLARGGAFVITIREGQPAYEASVRNGVSTRAWGAWARSFTFASAGGDEVAGVDAGDAIVGTWRIDANGHRGTITFERSNGTWTAALTLSRDEVMQDVSFDGATVRFVRPAGSNTQEYVGRLSDDGVTQRLAGTFYQGSARSEFPWSAERPRPVGAALPSPTTASEGVAIASDQSGTLSTAEGVVVSVPAGAVPITEAGGVGTMVFSAEPSSLRPVPPSGFAAVGPVVQLGPVGLTFEQPVSLTFPIPEGIDLATVVGLTTVDPADGSWVVVPGVVDPAARTVTVWTDHFSPWSVVTRPGGRPVDGGVLQISNGMTRGGGTVYACDVDDRDCRAGLPTSHGYGVCMVSWDLVDPNQRFWGVRDGMSRVATALDGQTSDWWLPDGTYVIEPFFHLSQLNQSPLYVPRHQMYVQPALTITLRGGQVVSFGDDYPRGYVEGWTHCHGGTGADSTRGPITSVGTGDVQVTLTWQADVDVDLHVTDPAGDTVYYGNRRVSSGGELDRDNMCGDFEWGRPENVYWPESGAPSGAYTVKVRYYGSCADEEPTVAWTVRVIVGGTAQSFAGVLAPDEEQTVTTFTVR
ncbi:MAG: LCCL domain-containing protein [Trueperaceae bacterium]